MDQKRLDGKQYIDAYEGTNYATSRRSFDPEEGLPAPDTYRRFERK